MRAGIATVLVVMCVTAVGCGGGGGNTLSSAVSSAAKASKAGSTSTAAKAGSTSPAGAPPSAGSTTTAANPAATRARKAGKSKLTAFCKRFNSPLAPLPVSSPPLAVRQSAQQTITHLLPFSIALGRSAAKVPDPLVAALATQYNDLTGIYQALVTAPAKKKLQAPLMQRAAKGVVVIRSTARQAGLKACAASFA